MALDVDVPPRLAERLNAASAARRWYPFDDRVIDWSVPLDGSWSYMPAGHSIFSGTDLLDGLDPEQRSFVERWEMTQLMRNIGHGEHLLNQGLLAMLWYVDPYDPSYRYLLHEVAEECQHMAMFNQWVRFNSDIETLGAGEESWAKTLGEFTEGLASKLPEAFWVNVLLFEFVGDDFNQAMRVGTGEGGRPLHPILAGIGVAHTAEEARHIAYARRWLEEGMAGVDAGQLAEIQGLADYGVQLVIDRRLLLPVRYGTQLEPYVSEAAFGEAMANVAERPASKATLAQLAKLVDFFAGLGVVSESAARRWVESGQLALRQTPG
ncbi:MAG TPA: diiron oxygenase [Acidimicrobiales bacterium]|nr:diiron oxygenase [Acidimicrobiales bacterium]